MHIEQHIVPRPRLLHCLRPMVAVLRQSENHESAECLLLDGNVHEELWASHSICRTIDGARHARRDTDRQEYTT